MEKGEPLLRCPALSWLHQVAIDYKPNGQTETPACSEMTSEIFWSDSIAASDLWLGRVRV